MDGLIVEGRRKTQRSGREANILSPRVNENNLKDEEEEGKEKKGTWSVHIYINIYNSWKEDWGRNKIIFGAKRRVYG
jgi:hypothetical protein